MADMSPESRTAMEWSLGIISTLFAALGSLILWVWNRHTKKLDDLEGRVSAAVSRIELIAHMKQLSDGHERMHTENRVFLTGVSQEIKDLRSDFREDIRDLHTRINEVLKSK